jgi:uridylate kinase
MWSGSPYRFSHKDVELSPKGFKWKIFYTMPLKDVQYMRIVLRIGGSVFASPIKPDLVNKYAALLKKLVKSGHVVAVVVGGGALAREFIGVAKSLGLREAAQDEVAISVSRIYAQLFLNTLGEIGYDTVPTTIDDAVECLDGGKIVVMGGLKPGMTTDTVAALIAEKVKADLLIKASDQEGIYDKDPRKHSDAVKLDRIKLENLSRVCTEDQHKAGIHQIIDPEAVKVLKRSRIKVVVVMGFKPENVLKAIEGKKVGTFID